MSDRISYRYFLIIGGAVFITIVLIGTVGFLGYKLFSYQQNISQLLQELSETKKQFTEFQRFTIESFGILKQMNDALVAENTQSQQVIEDQEEKLKTLQNLEQQISVLTLQASNVQVQSDILSQNFFQSLMPAVVKISCVINARRGTTAIGSGIVIPSGDGYSVLTNGHVISSNIRKQEPLCYAFFPQPPNYAIGDIFYETTSLGSTYSTIDKPDVGFLKIEKASDSSKVLSSIPSTDIKGCNDADIQIGDKVTIFGYPSFGGNSLTVTDGIISGIEKGPIYKTSAKIDQGNSGGIAVLNKKQCMIGMPTWLASGTLEGLGYIQSWTMISSVLKN